MFTPQNKKEGRTRFSKADWFKPLQDTNVTVIGAGGIGSWLTLFLARIGAQITLYDGDTFDKQNIGGQLMRPVEVGVNKAIATAKLIDELAGTTTTGSSFVNPIGNHYTPDSEHGLSPIVFSAVDSMDVRLMLYNQWKAKEDRLLFIDGRMGAELFNVFAASKEYDHWMDHYFPSSEADPLPCAYKATSHVGATTAALMIGQLTNYFSGNYIVQAQSFVIPAAMYEVSP